MDRIFVVALLCLFRLACVNAGTRMTLKDLLDFSIKESNNSEIYEIDRQLNEMSYKSAMHLYAPSYGISLSPQYSHSISPITQPDGTIKNYDVNNFTIAPSLSFSTPIDLTGGTVSLSSNLSYYKNTSTGSSSQNYSLNLYHISFSQPLKLVNEVKWGKRTAKATLAINDYNAVQDYLNIKYDVAKMFFDIVNYRSLIDVYKKQDNNLSYILELYDNLHKGGKILSVDYDEVNLSKRELEYKIKSYELSLKSSYIELDNYLNNTINVDTIDFTNPNVLSDNINTDYALAILERKQKLYDDATKVGLIRSVKEAKSNLWVDATFNLGFGTNSSADTFSNILDKKSPNMNVSMSVSVPISDYKDRRNKYNMAKLQLKENDIKLQVNSQSEKEQLQQYIDQYNFDRDNYYYLIDKRKHLDDELETKKTLLASKRIIYDDYSDTLNKYMSNELDIISDLSSQYAMFYRIEQLLMFDLHAGTSYLGD